MIIIGVIVAVSLTSRRLRARGQDPAFASDAAVWAVLLGIVGARIYHVISSPTAYFGADGHIVDVVKVWNGGLGIWGAVVGGGLGVWLACRRAGVSFGLFADAAAPGLVLAQAIGRWGNWFNQELYGRPSGLPWAVRISPTHRVYPDQATYQPTFLYESLWCLGVAAVLLVVDRRHRLGRGRLIALYVVLYTAGRFWIESLRIDQAEKLFGLRINLWVAGAVFIAGLVAFLLLRRPVDPDVPADAAAAAATGSAPAAELAAGSASAGITPASSTPASSTPASAAPADAAPTHAGRSEDAAAGGSSG
jgi:prolipoprotein diacylglyceryl transferase